VGTRADDDVGELDRGALEHGDRQSSGQHTHLLADVRDPLPGAVTEHDERGALERETEPAKPQRGVRRSTEVLGDDDVRRVRTQYGLDIPRPCEISRLHLLCSVRYLTDANPGLVIESLPFEIDRPGRSAPGEQNLDAVAHAGQRKGDESRR